MIESFEQARKSYTGGDRHHVMYVRIHSIDRFLGTCACGEIFSSDHYAHPNKRSAFFDAIRHMEQYVPDWSNIGPHEVDQVWVDQAPTK